MATSQRKRREGRRGDGASPPAKPKARGAADVQPDNPAERKERVLHTRVPDSLERHIKHRARNLGLSVSTVVRHVLLNTFGLVEDIVTDSTNLALSIAGNDEVALDGARRGKRTRDGRGDAPEVVGWQEAVLNLNGVCTHCNAVLRKGTRAGIGVREAPGPRVFLCLACLEKVNPE